MKRILVLAAALCGVLSCQVKDCEIASPNGEIKVKVEAGEKFLWSVSLNGNVLLEPSEIALVLDDGTVYGGGAKVTRAIHKKVNRTLPAQNFKRAEVVDRYNQITLCSQDFDLVFRVYDDGAAYRFVTKKGVTVVSEKAEFAFPSDNKVWASYVRTERPWHEQFYNSFENLYSIFNLSEWDPERLAFLPVTVSAEDGVKICITESDLLNYPGMYLSNPSGSCSLEGVYAPYPKDIEQGDHNMLQGVVRSREPFIYKGDAGEQLPWRVVIVAKEDRQLTENDMVWRLARPAEGDFSWVRPGKVAWDWWNDWNLKGVPFQPGVNNDTYKYYIDFASANGIEYVILDEGWAVNLKADLFQVVPEIDLPELCAYAAERNVRLVLWAGYWAFARDMEAVCEHYSKMGIAGWKIDFMNRDDQPMVAFYEQAARTAAKYGQIVDFHGAFKPAGLYRTWPNVLNFEGVYGLEQLKWKPKDHDQVTYDVILPFVRYVAGPADYTQGAMHNATRELYYPSNHEPMSQGTRCRQLAEYIIFDAPFTMLCDSPTNYEAEPECTSFIASLPTVWDETIGLDGKIGEYVVMARKSGEHWYVGAMTDWNERDITIELPEAVRGATENLRAASVATLWHDGPAANLNGEDYLSETVAIEDGRLTVHLAPGGGCVAVL